MTKLWGCVLGFACLVGMAAAAAQSPDPLITGTWIGGLESDGQFEFYAATVEDVGRAAGTATVPMRGLSGPLRSFSLEGDRVRIAGPASLTLSGIVSDDVITGDFEAQGGRSRGRFRLRRIPTVKPDQLNRYQGAYRFADGGMLLVDRAEIDAVSIPSALTVTNVTTGSVRVIFLRSESTFVAG